MERLNLSKMHIDFINSHSVNTKNLLVDSNNFLSKIWGGKKNLTLTKEEEEENTFNIVGTDKGGGFVFQNVNKTKGEFYCSIWLKGKGKIRLMLQEDQGNFTIYKSLNITLTQKWHKYSITATKEEDNNKILAVLDQIDLDDNFSLRLPKLIEIASK